MQDEPLLPTRLSAFRIPKVIFFIRMGIRIVGKWIVVNGVVKIHIIISTVVVILVVILATRVSAE